MSNIDQQKLEQFNFAHLSVAERILLAEALWDSVHDSVEKTPFTEAQKQELDRRVALDEAGLMPSAPWEEVRKRLK